MPNAVVQLVKHLTTGIELTFRSMLRALANRRLQRLYGNLDQAPQPARKDIAGQTAHLSGIVGAHCAAGTAAIETHRAAQMHLDAAEYAFSMMVAELREVMAAPEITWKPTRRPAVPQFIRVGDGTAQAA